MTHNVRTGHETGSGGSAVSMNEAHEKPYKDKSCALTCTDDDVPLKIHGTKEIPSSMERTRSGITKAKGE